MPQEISPISPLQPTAQLLHEARLRLTPTENEPVILPMIGVKRFGQRSERVNDPQAIADKLVTESKHFSRQWNITSSFTGEGGTKAVITDTVSPHTPQTIQNPSGEVIPAHTLTWWWKTDAQGGIHRIDTLSLVRLPPNERGNFIPLISKGLSRSFAFLAKSANLPAEDAAREILIYGLTGHNDSDTRSHYGLTQGAQSHPFGHINVCWHPVGRYKMLVKPTAPTPRMFLKHISPIDTLVMNRWSDMFAKLFSNSVTNFAASQNSAVDFDSFNVSSQINHTVSNNLLKVSWYEGIFTEFDKSVSLEDALWILTEGYRSFDKMCRLLFQSHTAFYQHYGNPTAQKETIDSTISQLTDLGINPNTALELTHFGLSFKPTLGQLLTWKQDATPMDKTAKAFIDRQERRYASFAKLLRQKPLAVAQTIAKLYNVDQFTAESLLEIIRDTLQNPLEKKGDRLGWETIEYTWGPNFSSSFFFHINSVDEDGVLQISGITITPRLFTAKGAFEDFIGCIIER